MLEKTVVVGPFQCNCRILACSRTGHAALVDPGDEADTIIRALESLRTSSGKPFQVKYLFHTHAHLDHIGATRGVREKLASEGLHPAISVHKEDEPLYLKLKMQGQLFGLDYDDPLPIEHFFEDGERIEVGDLRFDVIHTPGHSPGSVCLRLHEDRTAGISESLFSGDTLFQGSVGRTDLWGADQGQMFRSIRTRILTLDDETRVCPGHGPDTSIGIEKRENPFLT